MNPTALRQNRILGALPARSLARLTEVVELQELGFKHPLYEPGRPLRSVYFMLRGVASLLALSGDEPPVEIATVGHEGVVGLPAFLGVERPSLRAYIQIAGAAARVDGKTFQALCRELPELNRRMLRYTEAFITQIAQSSGCNRMHSVEERCARWLLMTQDRVHADRFSLTHELLSQMLGVRRPSVTVAAGALQAQGLIRYGRGEVEVIDRRGLEKAACECYGIIRDEYERLLGP